MKYFYLSLFALLLVMGWLFGLQNYRILGYPVSLRLKLGIIGFESIPIPLGGVVLLAFFIGVVFAMLWFLKRELVLRKNLFQANHQNNQLKKEVNNLRNQVVEKPEEDEKKSLPPSTTPIPTKMTNVEN